MGTMRTAKTTIVINGSIKFPFCGRNGLVERSLRPGARSWQAGMARPAGGRGIHTPPRTQQDWSAAVCKAPAAAR
jgi:hypothetical protein